MISIIYNFIFYHHHHHSVLPKAELSLQTQAAWLQFCPKAGLTPQTEKQRLQFYQELNRYGSFPLLSSRHSLFSIWTELRRSEKIPGVPTWRWGEWIWLSGPSGFQRNSLQELIISVASGFWPDQRSGNSNHPSSSPLTITCKTLSPYSK